MSILNKGIDAGLALLFGVALATLGTVVGWSTWCLFVLYSVTGCAP